MAFDRHELGEIALVGLIAGGLTGGTVLLLRLGFDPKAAFAFFGAIVGAAIAVGLSIAHTGRTERQAERREHDALREYLSAWDKMFREDLEALSDAEVGEGEKVARCKMAVITAEIAASFASEALAVGTHFNFITRVSLRLLVQDLEALRSAVQNVGEAFDELKGQPDFDPVQRSLRNILNGAAGIRSSLKPARAGKSAR